MKKGDIYWVRLENSSDHVTDGIRPCVIVQNNIGNVFSPNVIIVPITSKIKKEEMKTHVIIKENALLVTSMILCEQIMTVSKECINSYIGKLSSENLSRVNVALLHSLGIV